MVGNVLRIFQKKILKSAFFIWIFVLHMLSIYFVAYKVSNSFLWFLFLKSLDKVVMEMSTCEEPRAPNGPSPIATASGQRSVMYLHVIGQKRFGII